MKRISTLVSLMFLLISLPLLAAAPTVPSSNLSYNSIEGTSFLLSFTKGNGASRIIVVKAGSPVTGVPVNGAEYTANANFATAGTEFTAAGEYVVYKGTGNTITLNRLNPATTYHISIFEFNGTGAATQYLTVALTGSQSTASAPTVQASAPSFTNVTGNAVTLNWTNGNGNRRVVVARKGAPVTGVPEDLKSYSYNPIFGTGAVLNGDNYVVFSGTNNKATVSGLEPNTSYHFAVFEANGSGAPMYLRPGMTASGTTHAGPTNPSQSINFSDVEGNGLTISYGTGNGTHHLIIARKGAPVTAVPVNGATYTANPAFGLGTEIAPGEFVLNTTADSKVFTNMDPSSVYHFRIYEYDVTSTGQTYYLTSAYGEKSQSTAAAPTTQASAINFTNVTGNSVTMRFTNGNGAYRLSVIKDGGPVDANPVDLVKYNGSTIYGQGAQISPGNYALVNSNGSVVGITNLTPGHTYHVAVFEFNGNDFPVYKRPAAVASITLSAQPTTPASAFNVNVVEGNSFRANWTNGDGSRRVVIARKGSAVTARPVDGTTYTANDEFGQGQQIAPGEYVVYDGTFTNFDVENLEIGSTYHFAIFEYNPSASGPDYLSTSFLAATGSTAATPTQQTSALNATNIQSSQATIGFTKGNGSARIFFIREGSPVNADPQDLTAYSSSTVFGGSQVAPGVYCVNKTTGTSTFNITGLAASTVYHVAAYEYNGTTGPVYLRPAGTFSFTTAAGSGVSTPTVPASNASFSNVEGNKFNFNWNSGNGTSRLVVMRQGSAVTFTPANNSSYTANAAFGTGTDLGGGQYAVYSGTQSSLIITNLLPGTVYHLAIFEFNGTGANTRYLTANFLAANTSTATAPSTGSSGAASLAGNHSITLNWTAGSGSGRVIVMKQGSAVSAVPANLSAYPSSSTFGNGAQIATGEYVVYSGSGHTATITGLTVNTTYHFRIFEYNGSEAPVYNTANVLSGNATTAAALPVKWVYFNAKENRGEAILEWATANEQNAAYFVAERSMNNLQFAAIDSIAAKGSAGNNQYKLTDRSKPAGVVYYRIRQVDTDGKFEYSRLVRVEASGSKTALGVYPNPVQDVCRISLPQGMQQAGIAIYDMKGVQVQALRVQNGQAINLSSLSAGTYNVVVREGGEVFSTRIIKK